MSTTISVPELLEMAERSLELDIPTWRTDLLVDVCGPRIIVAPIDVPTSSQHCYNTLWKYLDVRDATDLLKAMCRIELDKRDVFQFKGRCPKCGAPNATITDFDNGAYLRAVHASVSLMEDLGGKAYRPPQRCYVGPHPLPDKYVPG